MNLNKAISVGRQEELSIIEELGKSLKTICNVSKTIDLSTFETYFLPYIIGELEHDDINNAVFIDNYSTVSGSIRTGINVVDSNDDVLYELPPLLAETNEMDLGISFNKIIQKCNSPELLVQRSGQGNLNTACNVIEKTFNDSNKIEDDIVKTITQIHIDYNDRKSPDKQISNVATSVKDDYDDDFIDY